jgi:DNA-binding transcriptional MerR regulator
MQSGGRVAEIPEKLFYKIGEVCEYTDTQPYVLRFWESEFPLLAPQKNRSGQRIYTREDIELVLKIKQLLYDEEYTIAGARKRLEREAGAPDARPAVEELDAEPGIEPQAPPPWTARRSPSAVKRPAEEAPPAPEDRGREVEGLRRRLADMESRWRRAEIALEEAEQARADYEERSRRVVAKLEVALEALSKLRGADESPS